MVIIWCPQDLAIYCTCSYLLHNLAVTSWWEGQFCRIYLHERVKNCTNYSYLADIRQPLLSIIVKGLVQLSTWVCACASNGRAGRASHMDRGEKLSITLCTASDVRIQHPWELGIAGCCSSMKTWTVSWEEKITMAMTILDVLFVFNWSFQLCLWSE